MLDVAEPSGDAAAEFDDPVDGLGTAVARAVSIEVGQERVLPSTQGLTEPGDLRNRAGRQPLDQLLGQSSASGGRGLAEHVSDVLGALIGDLDRNMIGMGRECAGQTSLLTRREAFPSSAENMTDPIERLALAASAAEGLLLDPAADIIDRSPGELDDVERIQHAGGALELVIDRVLVSLERVQRRDLDPLAELIAPLVEPVSVGLAGSARDQVQQPGSGVGPASQIDHPGELLRTAPARVTVMPDVFVHAQDLHVLEADRVIRGLDQDWPNLGPDRVPRRAKLPGQALDRRPLVAEQADRPPDRARAQQPPRRVYPGVLLDERDHLTDALETDPATLAPPNPHRPTRPRSIDHLDHHPAVTGGDDPAAGAAHDRIAGLHLKHQARRSLRDRDQVEAGEVEENIASVAAIERVRAYAPMVGHRRDP
ncbi:hypothetical protein HEMA109418_09415 [Helcobacillus massiliensis]